MTGELSKNRAAGMGRRKLLEVTVGSAAGLALWPLTAEARLAISGLDREAAARAADLAAGRKVHLRLLIPDGSQGNVRPVIRAFKAMTGIDVEVITTAVDDINTKLMLDQMLGDERHDLALPATFGIPELVEGGVLLDLTDFAAAYEPPALREHSLFTVGDSYDGRIYGFQADGDAYLMFYNKPWLEDEDTKKRYADRFGEALAIPETWQELDRQMAFFHNPAQNRFGGALFRTPTYVAWEWWIRFHAKGVWPFDAQMTPLIDGEAGVLAAEELAAASRFLYPEAPRAGLFDNWKAFARGNIYCNIGWGGTQKYLNRSTSKIRGMLAFSKAPGGMLAGEKLTVPYFNWGWNYVVTSQSEEPEIAYLFALFASSPEQSTLSIGDPDGYFDPHRPEHYRDQGVIEAYSQPFLTVHEASMRSVIPDLYLNGHGEYFGALSDGIMAILNRQKGAAAAMGETAKRWKVITHRLGLAKQQARWRALRSRYPASIANRLEPRLKAG